MLTTSYLLVVPLYVLHNFISLPSKQFVMKDIGDLFCRCSGGINFSGLIFYPVKYVHDLIRKFHTHTKNLSVPHPFVEPL